jgi:hypothetical protein
MHQAFAVLHGRVFKTIVAIDFRALAFPHSSREFIAMLKASVAHFAARLSQKRRLILLTSLVGTLGLLTHSVALSDPRAAAITGSSASNSLRGNSTLQRASEHREVVKQKIETKLQRSNVVTKRLAKKAVKPIRATLSELGHPIELLKSFQRYVWSDSGDDATNLLPGRPIDINLQGVPTYSLQKKSTEVSERVSLERYLVPLHTESFETKPTRNSATQLQVRMNEGWMMLYEVNRAETAVARDDIGVGFGLRYSF